MWEFFQNLKFLILLQISKNLAEKKNNGGFIFLCFIANSTFCFFYFSAGKMCRKWQEKGEEMRVQALSHPY